MPQTLCKVPSQAPLRGCLHIPGPLHPSSCSRGASIPWIISQGSLQETQPRRWSWPLGRPLPSLNRNISGLPRSQGSLRLSAPDPGLLRQQSALSTAQRLQRRGCCGSGQHRPQKHPKFNSSEKSRAAKTQNPGGQRRVRPAGGGQALTSPPAPEGPFLREEKGFARL